MIKFLTSRMFIFVVLSALGWILDFSLYYAEIYYFDVSASWANVISATVSAMAVYLTSQYVVFGVRKVSLNSIFGYIFYTEANVIIWALLIGHIADLIVGASVLDMKSSSIVAKIIVTPLSLACNFLVVRFLSKVDI